MSVSTRTTTLHLQSDSLTVCGISSQRSVPLHGRCLVVGSCGRRRLMNIMLSVSRAHREIASARLSAQRKESCFSSRWSGHTLYRWSIIGIIAGAIFTLILHYAVSFLHAALSHMVSLLRRLRGNRSHLRIYPPGNRIDGSIEALRYE